jgi:CBS domain-containing protein
MKIRHILQEKGEDVETIDAGQTIHEAIGKLNEFGIGALIVMENNDQIAGIITERDILKQCGSHCTSLAEPGGRGQTACTSIVRDAMTTDLIIGVPDDDPNYAMGIMSKNRIRHLPILEDGKLAGIISIGDLINAHLEEQVFENRTLREYIQGTSRHREPKDV